MSFGWVPNSPFPSNVELRGRKKVSIWNPKHSHKFHSVWERFMWDRGKAVWRKKSNKLLWKGEPIHPCCCLTSNRKKCHGSPFLFFLTRRRHGGHCGAVKSKAQTNSSAKQEWTGQKATEKGKEGKSVLENRMGWSGHGEFLLLLVLLHPYLRMSRPKPLNFPLLKPLRHSSIVHNRQKVETTKIFIKSCSIKKLCIHTMEYYSDLKKKEIL